MLYCGNETIGYWTIVVPNAAKLAGGEEGRLLSKVCKYSLRGVQGSIYSPMMYVFILTEGRESCVVCSMRGLGAKRSR